ncbi:MAG TPA: STAS domain-containing protein [Pseudonocardiaceae bacterium]|nr:STAS domain-containing protein [Pseudonocardiaceae bacterium]
MSVTDSTDRARPPFDVACGTSNVDGVLVLHLHGEFDGATHPTMSDQVAQALAGRPAALLLDLTDVDFLGSAALSVLVDARHEADRQQVELCLVAGRRVTLLPLELTGLTMMFAVFASVREALEQLTSKYVDRVAS